MESRSSSEKQLRDEAFMLLTYKDPMSLVMLVSHLTSPNNAQRSQAEMLFNCCKKEFADALCLTLTRLLKDGPTTETRIRTVNLLRTILTHPESRIWPNLSEDVQTKLRSRFLAFYQHEISKPISKTLCRLVSEIATQIYEDGEEWPELLDFLLRSVQSDSHKVQESALLVFADLPECGQLLIVNVLMPHVHTLYSTFLNRFASPSLSVRIAAYGAAIGLTHLFIYSEVPDRFQQLLLGMMASLSQMLLCHEDYAQQGLEQLIVLVMREPQILRPRLRIVVDGMLKIAEDQRWKQKTKQYAVEFLIILAEARYQAPKMMRTLPRQYIVRLISIPVNILSFIEDDPAWHDVRNEEGVNAGKSIIYDNGIEWLSRFSIALGGNTIVPIALELLPAYFSAPDWRKHHAGITTLSVIAKECLKVFIKHLEQFFTMILNSFQDPHPRVHWAAFNAISQLSTDLSPNIRLQYRQKVLPSLIQENEENSNPRVQAQAASAVLSYCKNCEPDIFEPYFTGILRKLLVFLKGNDKTAEERSTAFCIINEFAQNLRGPALRYCDTCLPYLLKAFSDENPEVQQVFHQLRPVVVFYIGSHAPKHSFSQEAARGIRICAEFGGSKFKTFAEGVISSLNAVMGDPNMLHSDNVKAYNIAISALGKLCEFHCDIIDAAQVVPTWLSLLPIKNDLIEAKVVHEQLCSMVEKAEADLLGPNNQNLSKIIAIFAEVLSQKNDLATVSTSDRMSNLLRRFRQNIPLTSLKAICSSLNTQQQELLESIFSS